MSDSDDSDDDRPKAKRRASRRGSVDLEVPRAFTCPICKELMKDPVITSDGHTYERTEIEKWLKEHSTSPVTNLELPNKTLTPNIGLRQSIEEFVGLQPERQRTRQVRGKHVCAAASHLVAFSRCSPFPVVLSRS